MITAQLFLVLSVDKMSNAELPLQISPYIEVMLVQLQGAKNPQYIFVVVESFVSFIKLI